MDERSDEEQQRREQLPDHEYRPERGVGGGVDPAGTSEEGVLEPGDEPGDPEGMPPVNRSG